MRQILLIEDDADIAEMLEINLCDEGFGVEVAASGEEGLARLRAQRYDLLVLDLMLPGVDGWEICREVRRMPHYLPVIIVSARSTEAHRVLGLELDADDYITKPFSMLELAARVRALFRRVAALQQQVQDKIGLIQRGALTLDPLAREVSLSGQQFPASHR